MRRVFMFLCAVALLGCGGSTDADGSNSGGSTSTGGASSGGSGGVDAGTGGTSGSGGATGCSGSAPMCAAGCGSDWFPETASCVDDKWKCPVNTILPEDCPPGTCWGVPLPAEKCGKNGWECKPELGALQACPQLLCATCNGFEGPLNTTDCNCRCENGEVHCAPQANPPCDIISNYCECAARPDCGAVTEDCFCECDENCPGKPPCDCICGGGKFLKCAAKKSDG